MASKSQGKEKGEATTFHREQQQLSVLREAVSLTREVAAAEMASWPVPTMRLALGWLPSMSAAEKERGQEVVRGYKAKHQKFAVTWGTDTESLGSFSAVQVQEYNTREKKKPQWCCPSSVTKV